MSPIVIVPHRKHPRAKPIAISQQKLKYIVDQYLLVVQHLQIEQHLLLGQHPHVSIHLLKDVSPAIKSIVHVLQSAVKSNPQLMFFMKNHKYVVICNYLVIQVALPHAIVLECLRMITHIIVDQKMEDWQLEPK